MLTQVSFWEVTGHQTQLALHTRPASATTTQTCRKMALRHGITIEVPIVRTHDRRHLLEPGTSRAHVPEGAPHVPEGARRALSEVVDDNLERGIEDSGISSGAILAIALGSTALFMLFSYVVKWMDRRVKRTESLSHRRNERLIRQNTKIEEKQKSLTRDRDRGLPPRPDTQNSDTSTRDDAQYVLVNVPEGAAGGDTIKVQKPGTDESVAVSVPAGLKAGDAFRCALFTTSVGSTGQQVEATPEGIGV